MIRFDRILDVASELDRSNLDAVRALFIRVFPREAEYAERMVRLVESRAKLPYDVIVITATEARGGLLGFSFVHYFPAIRVGFLDYIGTDPERRRRGIGQALYEASREYLAGKGARGLFLEIPPDDPEFHDDDAGLKKCQQRARFYELFGARPVLGSRWSDPPVRPDYDPPYLVYDPLGGADRLSRDLARKAAKAILTTRYELPDDHPNVVEIVRSFREDPVAFRPPRYERALPTVPPAHGHLKPIVVIRSDHHEIHHVRSRGYVERPARVRAIVKAMDVLPIHLRPVRKVGEAPIRTVHDGDYVSYLDRATKLLEPDETIYPQVFPVRRPDRHPREMGIRCGYYCADTFTPLSRNAYLAARAAVDCAVTGARQLLAGERIVYSICRPPGHHAERRIYGGFCYFNNAAIAAQELVAAGPVAVLDIDYHHGNGQQEIFYRRRDVLTVSIHGHPRDHYPYFAGFPDERGDGDGVGFNLNLTLKDLAGDEAYLGTLSKALDAVRRFKPRWLVLCLGFDIMRGDPTGNFDISTRGMQHIGERIGALNLPTLIVQEGGYSLRNLTIGSRSFFAGIVRAWTG